MIDDTSAQAAPLGPLPSADDSVSFGSREKVVLAILLTMAVMYTAVTLGLASGRFGTVMSELPAASQLLAVIGLVLLGMALRAGRWQYFSHLLNWRVPLLPSLIVFVASFALTATPAKAGELLKSALLKARFGVPAAESASVLIVERLGDLIALLILASVGLTLFANVRLYFLLGVVIVGAAGLVLCTPRLSQPLLNALALRSPFRAIAQRLLRLQDTTSSLLRPYPFSIGIVFALLGWTCEGMAFYLLATTLPVTISLPAAVSIYALSTVAGALSMLPGGLGGLEAVMVLLLVQIGAPSSGAAVVVVLFRICTLYFATFLGMGFFAWWKALPSPAGRELVEPARSECPSTR